MLPYDLIRVLMNASVNAPKIQALQRLKTVYQKNFRARMDIFSFDIQYKLKLD